MELATDQNAQPQITPELAAARKAMQAIKKQYFSPAQAETASDEINKVVDIVNLCSGAVVFNFDPLKEVKDGYALIIAPINQRTADSKTIVVGVSIGAIPTFELLQKDSEGSAWIKDQVTSAIMAKLANAVRPNSKTGEISATRPYSLQDFITSNRAEGILVTYRKYAPSYIKQLKSMGITDLTEATFRQILTSSTYAKSKFPKIPQSVWVKILLGMVKRAEEDNTIAGMLTEWIDTRDSAGMPEVKEIDYEGLEDLII